MGGWRIGIDVGGTFTDLVLLDDATGKVVHHKLPSTPGRPHVAPLEGIAHLLDSAGVAPGEIAFVGLGTTVATNLVLERKGAPTGLVTTEGFRDLLEIGRQKRPLVFDPFVPKPIPLVAREHRVGVRERIAHDGAVLTPLDEADVLRAAEILRASGVESVAICFLHAYANPVHEQRAAELLQSAWPGAYIVTSAALIPEVREYERLSTTVLNAYLMPRMQIYLAEFSTAVHALGIRVEPLIMSSSGGALRARLAARRPVDTLFSGPSGGVSGAAFVAGHAGIADTINFDMGGTSTEVCIVHGGRPELSYERVVEGFPVKTSSMAINTIGAGGSSIAWIDHGGLLHVGPESVGADPGPACYGHGGKAPTVTDAHVVLGRLDPQALLGGALAIDAAKAAEAIERAIAGPRGISVEDAAAAILVVANNNIVQAIRMVSTRKGLDPADYTLVAYGGAGPLHAAAVAAELGIAEILVPAGPGVLCAFGVLTKNIEMDLSSSRLVCDSDPHFADHICETFAQLRSRAALELADSGVNFADASCAYTVDARYLGQNFELSIGIELDGDGLRQQVRSRFSAAHLQTYGFVQDSGEVELVTFRLRVIVANPRLDLSLGSSEPQPCRAPMPELNRAVFFEGEERFLDCAIYRRADFPAGSRVSGPCVVEQMDTTTIVPPGLIGVIDIAGNLRLSPASPRAELAP